MVKTKEGENEAEDAKEEKAAEEAVGETGTGEGKKERARKRAVRRRKTRKEKESAVSGALRLAVETGNVEFGTRAGIKNAVNGSAKLIVVAANAPADARNPVLKYAKASNLPLLEFDGTSIELGSICGKPFPVAVLSVHSGGSSNIIELAKKK